MAIGLGVVSSVGCPGNAIERNVSSPPPLTSPEDLLGFKSETSVIYVPWAGEHRVLVAYNDQRGLQDPDPATGTNTLKPNWTLSGLSISKDAGQSWTNIGPLPPGPVCLDPVCVTGLRGDPWLATNGSRVLYTALAMTNPAPLPDDPRTGIAVAHSDDGGDSWSGQRVAVYDPAGNPDKPSVAMFGDTAVIAYVGPGVKISTSEDAGESWTAPQVVDPTLPGDPQNPIIRVVGRTLAYVAYIHRDTPNLNSYNVRVVRLDRAGPGDPWSMTTIYTVNGLGIAASIPGATGINGGGLRFWRDRVPMGFDVAADGTLLVVQRQNVGTAGADLIEVRRCPQVPGGPCNATIDFDSHFFTSPNFGQNQYQPAVTASHFASDNSVAVTWYQDGLESITGLPHAISVTGAFSTDSGATWSPSFHLGGGEPDYWEPCPTPTGSYYGDYFQSAILPLSFSPSDFPWIVTAFAATDLGCWNMGAITFDQHVNSVVW